MFPVTLTSFVILKSTIGTAVILGRLALLFDLLVSFSVLFTLTTLVKFPIEITLATISNWRQSSLAKSPTYQIPLFTS